MKASTLDQIRSSLPARDLELMEELRVLRLLTTRQLQRLLFASPRHHATVTGATRAAHRVLGRLQARGLVERLERRIGGAERGSAGSIWQLTPRGFEVASLGLTNSRRRLREPSSGPFVRHTLGIAELAVTIREAAAERGFELLRVEGEPSSWRSFVGEHGQTESLRPDLYTVTADTSYEQHILWEWDMATEHGPALVKKSRLYERWIQLGAAERSIGVVPQIVWVAPTVARQRFITDLLASDRRIQPAHFVVALPIEIPDLAFASLSARPVP